MTCEHYWRDGILLVERGDPDPHRDTCITCRCEHEVRGQIVSALPLVGTETSGDPDWEARVWDRIARLERRRRERRWHLGAALAAAFAISVGWWMFADREPSRPRIEIVPALGAVAMRSTSPTPGDLVRVMVDAAEEVRVYFADHLVQRCRAGVPGNGCTSDARGTVAEALLASPGDYRIVVIRRAAVGPVGRIDLDLRAILAAGGEYEIIELPVQ